MKSILERAIQTGKSLDMIYESKGKVISQRRIKVLSISDDSFKAYCYLRKQSRTFKLDNVLSVLPVRKTYNRGA